MEALNVGTIFASSGAFAAFVNVKNERLSPGCSVMRSDHLGHILLFGGPNATGTCNGTSDPKISCLCPMNCPSTYQGSMKVDLPGKFSLNLPSFQQCSKDLEEEIACNTGYESVILGDKQVCTAKQAAPSTACQSAKLLLANDKDIIKWKTRSLVSGQTIRVNADRKFGMCQVQVVPVSKVKTAQLNEELQLTIPVEHRVGLFNCANSPDCALPALNVVCPEGETNQHGVCQDECSPGKNQVMTEGGVCTTSQIVASVQIHSLHVTLKKLNDHLIGNFATASYTVDVGPSAKYNLDWTHHLTAVGDWVRAGANISVDSYNWKVPLFFNASTMSDGTRVNATLSFTGHSNSVTAGADTIQISGIVESTPSLQHSEITVPTEADFGTPVSICITAIDVDGLPIQNAHGRFFVLALKRSGKVQNYSSTSEHGSGQFRVEVPSTDLKVGKHKVPSACLDDGSASP